jgi:hypothetical protein
MKIVIVLALLSLASAQAVQAETALDGNPNVPSGSSQSVSTTIKVAAPANVQITNKNEVTASVPVTQAPLPTAVPLVPTVQPTTVPTIAPTATPTLLPTSTPTPQIKEVVEQTEETVFTSFTSFLSSAFDGLLDLFAR